MLISSQDEKRIIVKECGTIAYHSVKVLDNLSKSNTTIVPTPLAYTVPIGVQ